MLARAQLCPLGAPIGSSMGIQNTANIQILREMITEEAVKKWEDQPTMVDRKRVMISFWVAFRFQLEAVPSVEVLSRSERSTPKVVIGGIVAAQRAIAPPIFPGTVGP